ncbi:MAG: alpha-amylase family protein [Planctomycetota bacterium]|nr:alpha-amylase family protein [Planctomycetota bacterium]
MNVDWRFGWRRTCGLVVLVAGLAVAQEPEAAKPQAQQAGAEAAADGSGFQRILWVPADQAEKPAVLQAVRKAGFDAINLGPTGDFAAVVEQGLGYYLDQPIGKGYLELREPEWAPLRVTYERDRDPRALVRPTCLGDPALRTKLAARAGKAAAGAAGSGLRFVALADEASSTLHNAPLDTCYCQGCLSAFGQFLRERYGSVEELDLAWATEFGDWEAVEPLSTDQVRRRELGGLTLPENLRAWSDWLEFQDSRFAGAVAEVAASVQRELPDVPVGLTGLQVPGAFGGNDYVGLLPGLTLLEPYDIGGSQELALSLGEPRAEHWFTLVLPDEPRPFESLATAHLAAAASRGNKGMVVWSYGRMLEGSGEPTKAGAGLQRALQRLERPLDALAGAQLEYSSVWIVESQASVRAWWMLDSVTDGMTWVRRLASHEAKNSTSQAARRSWIKLLSDLGLTPRFVGEHELPERLLREQPRCLILPAAIALSDRNCQAISSYAYAGGTVLADHSTALYDTSLVRRSTGGLDELFGITARSLRWDRLRVREGRCGQGDSWLAEIGLEGQLVERQGDEVLFVERRPGRGRAVYLNLPVCEYAAIRLDSDKVSRARDLRRRVSQVLRSADVEPFVDVRGEGLPTCIARTLLRAPDGRQLLSVRVDAIDRPKLLAQLAREGARDVRLFFDRPRRLASLTGEPLGSAESFEFKLDVYAGLFVEVAGR